MDDVEYIMRYLGIPVRMDYHKQDKHTRLMFDTGIKLTVMYKKDFPHFWAFNPDRGLAYMIWANFQKYY